MVAIAGVGAVLAVTVGRALDPLTDPDMWWHLVAGQGYVYEGWSLAAPPPLTPFATVEWFSRSWLPEMAIAIVNDLSGLTGIAWVYGLGLVVFVLTVYASLRRWADPLVASLGAAVTWLAASASTTERPQLVGYILLAVVVAAWLRAAETLRPPWWTIPVMWVWSASHGTWILGVMIGIGVTLGLLLDRAITPRRSVRWLGTAALGLAVGALSPVGFGNILAFAEVRGFQDYISEFQPPSLEDPHLLAALALAVVALAPAVRTRSKMSWTHLALLSQGLIWTLYTVRSIAWGAIMIAPLAAMEMQELVARNDERTTRVNRTETATLAVIAVAALTSLALLLPSVPSQAEMYPWSLGDELARIPAGSPVVNTYHLGGWLEWEHPNVVPVIDGNTNGFLPNDLKAHIDADKALEGWQEYVEDTGARHALLDTDSALELALRERSGWHVVDEDENWVLLEAPR